MNVVVLGYGRVGRALVDQLLLRLPFASIYVLTSAPAGITKLPSRLHFVHLAGGWTQLRATTLPTGIEPEIIVNCLPPYLAIRAMEMALNEKAHYLDTSACEPIEGAFDQFPYGFQKSFHQRFLDVGRCAILSFGCDPGLTNAIIREGVSGMKGKVYGVHIFDVDVTLAQSGLIGMNQEAKAADCAQDALVYLDGKFVTHGGSRSIRFDAALPYVHNLRLMYHDELASIPLVLKNIAAMSFWGTDVDLRLANSAFTGAKVVIPIKAMELEKPLYLHVGVLLETWTGCGFESSHYHFIEIRGGSTSQANPANAVGLSAAIPAAVAVEAVLKGNLTAEGVCVPEEITIPALFSECEKCGLTFGKVEGSKIISEGKMTSLADLLRV